MWDDPGLVDVLRIDSLLDALAAEEPVPGGGSAAALVGAMAAALCAKVARFSDDGGAAAQAEALRRRLTALAAEDAAAFVAALEQLQMRRGDFDLGRALELAADVPLRIAEASADVAGLGAALAGHGKPDLQPDARVAAVLAAAAARSCALLVETNLGAAPGDERVGRARQVADGAATAAAAV
jgi:formiminotetrahydrofolate cyclodeaminase